MNISLGNNELVMNFMDLKYLDPSPLCLHYFLRDFLKDGTANQRFVLDPTLEDQNIRLRKSRNYRINTVKVVLDFFMRMVAKIVEVDMHGKQ